MNDAITKMHARRAELRASGDLAKPKSVWDKLRERPGNRALAMRCYHLDLAGVPPNLGLLPREQMKEMREEAASNYRGARAAGLKAEIRKTCWACVGGGADPGARERIRACRIVKCPLHGCRAYQPGEVEDLAA